MKLKEYIKGKRRGKDANRLEREAMNDPFLQDAIDGFDSVEGNHINTIQKLEQKVKKQSGKTFIFSSPQWKVIGVAASLVLLIGVGVLLFRNNQIENPPILAMDSSSEKIEKYIPQNEDLIFEENEEKSVSSSLSKKEIAKPAAPTVQTNKEEVADFVVSESDIKKASELEEFREMEIEIEELLAAKKIMDSGVSLENDYHTSEELALKPDSVKIQMEPEILAFEEIFEEKQKDYLPNKSKAVERSGQYMRKSSSDTPVEKIIYFGKEEFKQYFKENHTKNICGTTKIIIKAEFMIDGNGTPSKIKIKEATCTELEKEFISLLENGPKWTTINERIRITIKLD